MSAATAVSQQLQSIAADLDKRIQSVAGERVAFMLLIWTEGRANYVSTARDREQVAQQLRDLLAHWDAGMPDVPAHQVG